MTQEQLAERGDVSVRYLRRIETGCENLTLSALVWLANLLEVKVESLLQAPAELSVKRGRPKRGPGVPDPSDPVTEG
jgi:transcriptional regulator with XRE-family HTH domain